MDSAFLQLWRLKMINENNYQIIIYSGKRLSNLPIDKGERAYFSKQESTAKPYNQWLVEELKKRKVPINGNITHFIVSQCLERGENYAKYLHAGFNRPTTNESGDKDEGIWLKEEIAINHKGKNREKAIDLIVDSCKKHYALGKEKRGSLMVITEVKKGGINHYIKDNQATVSGLNRIASKIIFI